MMLLAVALAVPLVVHDPTEHAAYTEAVAVIWPDGGLAVTAADTEVPRFEVHQGTVSWVTDRGTAVREVGSPEDAVVLMRSWSLSPDRAAGWLVAPVPEEVPEPLDAAFVDHSIVASRARRRRGLLDGELAVVLRLGGPVAHALPGVALEAGLRRGPIVGRTTLGASSFGRLSRNGTSTFGAGFHFGVAPRILRAPTWYVEGFLLSGVEVQRRVSTGGTSYATAHASGVLGAQVLTDGAGIRLEAEVLLGVDRIVRAALGPVGRF
ncbi:MAG: hypothetical protein KC656_24120 [Myxococcales bacterium]|nr:hypothetical protein [Myxococcales bacterium]MCB9670915.1 hypothetical protein [Alphaproteobacteria bacterium]